jgi:hypothetical protein
MSATRFFGALPPARLASERERYLRNPVVAAVIRIQITEIFTNWKPSTSSSDQRGEARYRHSTT